MSPTPLAGRQVVITRRREDATELLGLLEKAGAQCLCLPMIRFAPPQDPAPLDRARAHVSTYDLLLLTSRQAARAFCQDLSVPEPKRPQVCALGQATAREIKDLGWPVDLCGEGRGATSLAKALIARGQLRGRRALYPCSSLAGSSLVDRLTEAGARVDRVVAYRTLPPDEQSGQALRAVLARTRPLVIFASPSAVKNFADLLRGSDSAPARDRGAAWSHLDAVAIGATTLAALRDAGATHAHMAQQPDPASLLAAAIEINPHNEAAPQEVTT